MTQLYSFKLLVYIIQMLFFLRHGERVDSVTQNHPDYVKPEVEEDPQLTTFGVEQARRAGLKIKEMIADLKVQTIEVITSAFLRCIMTGQQICKVLDLKTMIVDQQLSEILLESYFQTSPMKRLAINFPNILKKFISLPFEFVQYSDIPYPQKLQNFRQRTKACSLKYFNHQNNQSKICIIVGHSKTIRTLIGDYEINKANINYCCLNAISKQGHIALKYHHELTRSQEK